jgi:AraC-like DNA-binding protein
MKFTEIAPGEKLRQFIKCYFVIESDADIEFADAIFPTGHIEIVFNLGDAVWQSAVADNFQTDPPIELLGQITQPLKIKSKGKSLMLGIRFFPHTAAYFFEQNLAEFNNQISDLSDLFGHKITTLHSRLLETTGLNNRIDLIENYLLSRFLTIKRKSNKIVLVDHIVKEMQKNAFAGTIETIAPRYAISPRYLQKLFLQYVGVTPKIYSNINRFQRSLKQVNKGEASLTAIAYNSGYADQSHFIREFKSFTGTSPSIYLPEFFSVNQLNE